MKATYFPHLQLNGGELDDAAGAASEVTGPASAIVVVLGATSVSAGIVSATTVELAAHSFDEAI